MRIIHTAAPLPTDTLGKLAVYNGFDTMSLLEILPQILTSMSPSQQAIYNFEMELQAALLEMEFNGIPVDPIQHANITAQYEAESLRIETYLHELCLAIGYYEYYLEIYRDQFAAAANISPDALPTSWTAWLALPLSERRTIKKDHEPDLATYHKALKKFGPPYLPGNRTEWRRNKNGAFNANSNADKLRLFYHFFGDPRNLTGLSYPAPSSWSQTRGITERRGRKADGSFGPTTDRDALDALQKKAQDGATSQDAVYWAQPFISCCLAIADYTKALGFLHCKLENGDFKSTFSISTETGRLNSRTNSQGYGSNGQNISPRLRIILTCPPGWKIAAPDYEQIESRTVAARCFTQFGAIRYIAMTECGDEHSLAASMVWDSLPWPQDFTLEWTIKHGPFPTDMVRAAKKLAKVTFYREKSRRDMSKMIGHASKYWGKPPQIAKQSHVDVGLIKHYQEVLFGECPELLQWHDWIIQQVQLHQEYTTIFGRTRKFWGRASDSATIREAIAHDGQSSAADYTNTALLRIHRATLRGELPIKLFLQKHDEVGVRFLEKDAPFVIAKLCDIMEYHLTLTSPSNTTRDWYVPVEAQTGWNLGHCSKTNPDGLVVWRGTDDRTRGVDMIQSLMGVA